MCRLRNIALESVTEKCDRRMDDGQSDPNVSLCFASDTTKPVCEKVILWPAKDSINGKNLFPTL